MEENKVAPKHYCKKHGETSYMEIVRDGVPISKKICMMCFAKLLERECEAVEEQKFEVKKTEEI